jgi:hypothetical protein
MAERGWRARRDRTGGFVRGPQPESSDDRGDSPVQGSFSQLHRDPVGDDVTGPGEDVLGTTGPDGHENRVPDDEHGDMDNELTHASADDDQPLDLSALRADDELLNAIGGIEAQLGGSEPELGSLLLSWRQDVDAEPADGLVDTETAMHVIFQAKLAERKKRRPRFLVPLASGAAVLVVVFAGMGLAARDAQPGDTLWGLTQVLYSDHARSIQAAADVRSDLSRAGDALGNGQFDTARTELAQAGQTIPSVDGEDGQAGLEQQQQNLMDQLAASTGPNAPGVPVTSTTPGNPVVPPPASSSTGTDTSPSAPPTTTTQSPPPDSSTDPSTPASPPPSTTTDTPANPSGGDTGAAGAGDQTGGSTGGGNSLQSGVAANGDTQPDPATNPS